MYNIPWYPCIISFTTSRNCLCQVAPTQHMWRLGPQCFFPRICVRIWWFCVRNAISNKILSAGIRSQLNASILVSQEHVEHKQYVISECADAKISSGGFPVGASSLHVTGTAVCLWSQLDGLVGPKTSGMWAIASLAQGALAVDIFMSYWALNHSIILKYCLRISGLIIWLQYVMFWWDKWDKTDKI